MTRGVLSLSACHARLSCWQESAFEARDPPLGAARGAVGAGVRACVAPRDASACRTWR